MVHNCFFKFGLYKGYQLKAVPLIFYDTLRVLDNENDTKLHHKGQKHIIMCILTDIILNLGVNHLIIPIYYYFCVV